MLILMAGLPGSGKTTLATELARRLPASVLSKDELRAVLFAAHEIEYSREQDDFCMDMLYQLAGYRFQRWLGCKVIVDGRTFSKHYQIEVARQWAEKCGVPLCILYCACSADVALGRIRSDQILGYHPAANRDVDLYRRARMEVEPLIHEHLRVPTDEWSIEEAVEVAVRYVVEMENRTSN